MKNKLPKISIIIMTFNGGELLKKCLFSIRNQNYPQSKVEIIVVDDASDDNSVETAKHYKARVFVSGKRDMYLSWAIGLHKVTGNLVYMLDQDIELRGKDFFQKMVKPFLDNQNIIASFTRAYPHPNQPWITRYISYHPFQCDPIYEYLTPQIEKSIIETKRNYFLCEFTLDKIPAESRMMYRVDILRKTPNWKMKRIFDHDLLVKTIIANYNLIAYVPKAGIYHHHAESLGHLLRKRIRNLQTHYFPYNKTLEYRWMDPNNRVEVFRMILWVMYANLLLPAGLRGLIRFFKYKDWALLMEPIVTILTTDVILWSFLTNKVGRNILFQSLRSFFSYTNR